MRKDQPAKPLKQVIGQLAHQGFEVNAIKALPQVAGMSSSFIVQGQRADLGQRRFYRSDSDCCLTHKLLSVRLACAQEPLGPNETQTTM